MGSMSALPCETTKFQTLGFMIESFQKSKKGLFTETKQNDGLHVGNLSTESGFLVLPPMVGPWAGHSVR